LIEPTYLAVAKRRGVTLFYIKLPPEYRYSLAEDRPLSVETDKPSYLAGDQVKISGSVGRISTDHGTVLIQIHSNDGSKYRDGRLTLDPDNSFYDEFKLTGNLTSGRYTVRAIFEGQSAQTSFLVISDGGADTPIYTNFFFADIVGLSDRTLNTRRQVQKINVLNNSIKECDAYRLTPTESKFVLPTGDGVAIGFIQGSHLPFQLSMQLHQKLAAYNSQVAEPDKVRIRIGINAAPVFLVKDLLNRMNVWGDGIILAKRVMDIGSEDHILLSSRVAEDLMRLPEFRQYIRCIGEYTFKHGERDVLYFAYGPSFGSPHPPGPDRERSIAKERINLAYYSRYENGAYFYDRSENLPSFSNLLSYARQKIIIAGVSLTFDPVSHKDLFIERLNDGMSAVIILPELESRFIPSYEKETRVVGLKDKLAGWAAEFYRWKEQLINKNSLYVGSFGGFTAQSMIIIDPEDNDRAMIQVEYHDIRDVVQRRFEIVFKRKNAAAFNQYLMHYKSFEEKARPYLYKSHRSNL
jgi:class 3 adenylate cyclase